jgi:hypothetical protein
MTNLQIRLIDGDFFTLAHPLKARHPGASTKLRVHGALQAGAMR